MPVRTKWGTKKWGTFKWGGSGVIIGTTEYEECYDLHIEDILTQEVNTCEVSIINTSANKPRAGQAVEVVHLGKTIFAGRVSSIQEEKLYSEQGNRASNSFIYHCQCQDYSFDLMRYLVAYTYASQTMWAIVNSIVNTTTPYSSDTTETLASLGITIDATYLSATLTGKVINKISFNYKTPFECFTQLCELVGYDWLITTDKKLQFFSLANTAKIAPLNLEDDGLAFYELNFEPEDASQIRNRVYVRGGSQLSPEYTQTSKPAAAESSINLDYEPYQTDGDDGINTITVNGTPATVGIDNVDDAGTHDFLLNQSEKVIKCDTYNAGAFIGTETIVLKYMYKVPLIVRVDDTQSQQSLKALCGGTGIFEYKIDDDTINTRQWAIDRAKQEIDKYKEPTISGSFKTLTVGFYSGQKIALNLTDRGFSTAQQFLIRDVQIDAIGGNQLEYTVQFCIIYNTFNQLLLKMLDFKSKKDLSTDEIVDKIYVYTEEIDLVETVSTVVSAPPFKWSNDAGTTPNKLRWNIGEWS
jgi:hypothetical protein